jgi:hypothetical protein
MELSSRPTDQVVKSLVRPTLMWSCNVAGRMEHDHATSEPIRVHSKRRLLTHGPTGKEDGGGHTEERLDFCLELGDDPSISVEVGFCISRDLSEKVGRLLVPVIPEEAGAGRQESRDVGLGCRCDVTGSWFGLFVIQLVVHPFASLAAGRCRLSSDLSDLEVVPHGSSVVLIARDVQPKALLRPAAVRGDHGGGQLVLHLRGFDALARHLAAHRFVRK